MAVRTAIFKVHNPGQKKRAIIEFAFKQYTLQYGRLLKLMQKEPDKLKELATYTTATGKTRYSTTKLMNHLRGQLNVKNCPLNSSLQTSLAKDVSENLISYLELIKSEEDQGKEVKTGYPTGRYIKKEEHYLSALEEIKECIDLEEEARIVPELLKIRRERFMPLLFGGVSVQNDQYMRFLKEKNSDKYIALLFLLSDKNRFIKQPINVNNTVCLKTGKDYKKKTRTAVIVELEMDEEYHRQGFILRGSPQCGRLVKDGDDYYLHIAFQFKEPDKQENDNFLGIDRGVLTTAAYAIVDKQGKLIEVSKFEDEINSLQRRFGKAIQEKQRAGKPVSVRDYKTKSINQVLHTIANSIIEKALKTNSQIVLEKLNVQTKGSYTKSQFKKFEDILTYKCSDTSLKKPQQVFAAYSSQICSCCGNDNPKNRDRKISQHFFKCTECGFEAHADENASVNIGRRAIYRKKDYEAKAKIDNIKPYLLFHREVCSLKIK